MDTFSHLTQLTLGETLSQVAARSPERTAILCDDRTISFGEWEELSLRVANFLVDLGVEEGGRVGLWMDKQPEVPIVFLGCARARAVAVPINFKLPHSKRQFQVERFGLSVIFTQRSHLPDVERVLSELPAERRVPDVRVVVIDADAGGGPYSDWSAVAASRASEPPRTPRVDDMVYLNMTSGTTGRPKAAVTTHEMIQWNTRSSIETLGFGSDDVFLCMFSVFAHPHELFARPLAVGARFTLVDSLNARLVARAVERHKITWIMAVPSFYEMLAERAAGAGADLSSLRMLEAGGAHLPPEAYARISEKIGAPLVPVWGSTETSGVGIAQRVRGARTPGSMGFVARHYGACVVREDGRTAGPDEVGELWMKGPAVVGGYHGDEEETVRHFVDGWYRTDDLVRRSADGEFAFCGRRSEMMKIGGIRVFPLEIELTLRSHPAVADAVVVRAEETLRGEIARAVVVLRAEATVRELRDHCRAHLALYQVPRLIEIWDEIPRNPAGKVDKRAIIETPPVT